MNWIVLSAILMMSAFGIGIILYFISKVIKYPKLESWAKGEIMEVLATAGIIGVILGVIMFINSFGCGIYLIGEGHTVDPSTIDQTCQNLGLSPSNAAVLALHDNVLHVQRQWYTVSWEASMLVNMATHFKISIGGKKIGNDASPASEAQDVKYDRDYSKKGWLATIFEFPTIMLGTLIFYTMLSIEMIKLFDYLLIFFLPAGIILRAFPGSRGMGAMLIAIGIGFGYVYPISLTYLQFTVGNDLTQRAEGLANEIEQNKMLDITYYDYMCFNDISDVAHMKDIVNGLIDSGAIDNARNMLENVMNWFIILFLIQLIALVFAITFTRSFAMLLGADLAEIGTGLFKFL